MNWARRCPRCHGIGRFESGLVVSGVQRERLVSVRRMAEDNVAMVRSMALLLRPSMLDELGWMRHSVAGA